MSRYTEKPPPYSAEEGSSNTAALSQASGNGFRPHSVSLDYIIRQRSSQLAGRNMRMSEDRSSPLREDAAPMESPDGGSADRNGEKSPLLGSDVSNRGQSRMPASTGMHSDQRGTRFAMLDLPPVASADDVTTAPQRLAHSRRQALVQALQDIDEHRIAARRHLSDAQSSLASAFVRADDERMQAAGESWDWTWTHQMASQSVQEESHREAGHLFDQQWLHSATPGR